MPFNGSGLYSPPSSLYPIQNGTLEDADQISGIFADVATGISNTIAKDGQTTITANLPLNGFKLIGVGPATNRTDAATLANYQDGTGVYVTLVGGTGDAITLSPSPAIAAYATGQHFRFMVTAPNTSTTPTVAVSGLAAKLIVSDSTHSVVNGDLFTGRIVDLYYDASLNTGAGAFLLAGGGIESNHTNAFLSGCVLNNCLVGANPTSSLGVVSKQYVDALWSTGDVKITIRPTADTGWVVFNDGTIGGAASGATTRANADTESLFELLWNNTVDGNCAVSGGRGASAASDFAANKTIALPKTLGRALAVAGAGSGLSARALAAFTGFEDAINVLHGHTVTDAGHLHTFPRSAQGGGGGTATSGDAAGGSVSSGVTSSSTTGLTVDNSGSSGTGRNMQPSVFFYVHVKL